MGAWVDSQMSIAISGLFVYPVKSCAGTSLASAVLGPRGIVGDRSYSIVGLDGRCLTQREKPKLALIVPTLTEGCLRLTAPGMPALDVPVSVGAARQVVVLGDVVDASDQGDEAAAWLSQFLDSPCRLARVANDDSRLSW